MIITQHRCIFLHIPKTGGLSINNFFANKYYLEHRTLEELIADEGNKFLLYINFFKFTFVRNPWDRFVSCYFYFKQNGGGTVEDIHDGSIIREFTDFTEFVLNFKHIRYKFKSRHFLPQTFWLDKRLDFIGRFENLAQDFYYICNLADMPHKIKKQKLPHLNSSNHIHYTTYYNDITREIIADEYASDIEVFNYKFDKQEDYRDNTLDYSI